MTTSFDTWAWIEFFAGSRKGERPKNLVESAEEICTPAIALTELKAKFLREKQPYEEYLKFVMQRSRVIPLTAEVALRAAEYKHKGLHTSDAIIYATSQSVNSTLLTGDPHFNNYEKVEML